MKNNIIKLLLSCISVFMIFGVIVFASESPVVNITVDKNSNSSIQIQGLPFDVYSVQLELTADNSSKGYTFTSSNNEAYSLLKQNTNDSKTNLTIYVDSKTVLGSGETMELGNISGDVKPNFSTTGKLILLNEKLRPTSYENISINVDYSQLPPDIEDTTENTSETTTDKVIETTSDKLPEVTTDATIETTTSSSNNGGGGGSSSTRYKVTAQAGEGGSIEPKGEIYITSGDNKTFTFTANKGYKISDVKVNNVSVSIKDNAYTINNIKADTKIVVSFIKIDDTKVSQTDNSSDENKQSEENKTNAVNINNKFSDVNNHWAQEAIYYLYDKGIVNGITENTFAPNNNITRAEFVTLLAKTSEIDSYNYSALPFKDVNKVDWFAPYVAWAFENSIVKGIDNETFAPKSFITREQMAVMISNFADYKEIKLEEKTNVIDFKDQNYISSYAISAVKRVQSSGIINGRNGELFAPKENATRAESAMMIYNLIK